MCCDGQYGDGSTCTHCPENTYSPSWNASVAAVEDCLSCPPNTDTNGYTSRTECTSCMDGCYGSPPDNCSPCPEDHYELQWSSGDTDVGDCNICPSGSTTKGLTGQTSCDSCKDGYYGTPPSSCSPCPEDHYISSWTSSIDIVGDCLVCPSGSTTNSATGQASCDSCKDGYVMYFILYSLGCTKNTFFYQTPSSPHLAHSFWTKYMAQKFN